MGYNKDDELAINTIRLLAVSLPPPSLIEISEPSLNSSAGLTLGSKQELVKLIWSALHRSMPPSKPIPAIPAPPWAWLLLPTFSSISS